MEDQTKHSCVALLSSRIVWYEGHVEREWGGGFRGR